MEKRHLFLEIDRDLARRDDFSLKSILQKGKDSLISGDTEEDTYFEFQICHTTYKKK